MPKSTGSIIPIERIQKCIYLIRGRKVLLDSDLAQLYGVETKVLNQAVARHKRRFPSDFMFRLSKEEFNNLRSQIVTSSWGGRRYPPYAFTEQGVAMLSSVLQSIRAIEVNIAIMRAFVKLKRILASHKEVSRKLKELEQRMDKHGSEIQVIFDAIYKMINPATKPKQKIGFIN